MPSTKDVVSTDFDRRWIVNQADIIALKLAHEWGNDWVRLVGPRIAKALYAEAVLNLVRTQAHEGYQRATALAEALFEELELV